MGEGSAGRTISATGIATRGRRGDVLDVRFRDVTVGDGTAAPTTFSDVVGTDARRSVERTRVALAIDLDAAPLDAVDVWLRLTALSMRCVRPHTLSMDGIFGLLTNVVWTSVGPCEVDGFDETRAAFEDDGVPVDVKGLDKFPRMTDYVVPTGVRIADASRVRLGAHLGEGTVVMHEGFVNFHAGTLGQAMVEGRISAGVKK
jgi:2,3,4,5-tetrahydropyridine-2,6-dicarboxylate N-succinyltransferase